jgi:hypothetical protein
MLTLHVKGVGICGVGYLGKVYSSVPHYALSSALGRLYREFYHEATGNVEIICIWFWLKVKAGANLKQDCL